MRVRMSSMRSLGARRNLYRSNVWMNRVVVVPETISRTLATCTCPTAFRGRAWIW